MDNENLIKQALDLEEEVRSAYMAEILMDDTVSTWGMYSELATLYVDGSRETQDIVDRTCRILTERTFLEITENILKKQKED